MKQWEIVLEYYPGGSARKAHWYWQVCSSKDGSPILGAGRAESLSEAMDDASSVVDVDLNNDWV